MKKFLLALLFLCAAFIGRSQSAPEATPQTLSTNEDTQLNGTVTGTDADGDALTFVQGATSVQHGSLTLNSDGTFIYTPDPNYNGSDAFTFKAYDGSQYSSEATVSITVNAVNDPPVTNSQSVTVAEDGSVDITLSGSDVDGDALTFTPGTPSHGTLTLKSTTTNIYTYVPSADYNGSDAFTFTANDGTVDSDPATVSITVTAINDAPSFTKGADQTINEDAGAQSVTGWATNLSAGPSNESGQILSFTVTNNNSSLFSVQPAVDAGGNLTYTPAANANGVATVSVNIKDNGGTANGGVDQSAVQTFTITVTPVNDAPTFTLIGNQTVAENAGPQSVPNAVTNQSAGPSNESTQTLTLSVSNNNNSLFTTTGQPQIDATTGALTYTPALDAYGQATITVTLKDDGGTANGGVDATTQTFIITVTHVTNSADRKVILNEVYTNPGSNKNEFFELYNTSTNPTPVQLDCYTLVIYYKTKTASGFYVLDLPQSTINAKSWYIGASAQTINVQNQTGITANFDWSNLGSTGYLKKYKVNGSGYTDVTSAELKTATDFNSIFQPIQGGGDVAVFLFNQGSYVNGFMAGFGSTTSVPSQIRSMPNLPVAFASGSCGTGFTINWATITNAEFNTGGASAGTDNGYARAWDGNCGSWQKTANGVNLTPGKTNVQQGSVQTSILTTSQNIICGTRLDFSVSSADASVFPVDVRIYEDVNKNGILDAGDVLFGYPMNITSSTTSIQSVSGLDPTKTYLVVYNTALGCSDAILAPSSTPSLTTAQYNLCNQQLGFAITAATQVALADAFPITVKFLNNGTAIGNAITVNAPSATIYYSDFLTTAFDPTKISIEYVPSGSGCLSTITVSNASSASFTQASGTLQTNEQYVPQNAGAEFPGQMQARVTGITSTTGYTTSNIVPVTATLYYDNDPTITTDDVAIESYQFNSVSSTYHVFNYVFTKDKDQYANIKVVYTTPFSCLNKSVTMPQLIPLPVHFLTFAAIRKDDSKVALSWTTATEQNNRGFYVQRNEGSGWKDVAFVFSQAQSGTSTQELSYSYTDLNPSKGVSQYRILQVDLDGHGVYSLIRSVNGSAASGKLLVYPNPSSTGSVTLAFAAQGSKTVIVSDVTGRTVQQYKEVTGSSLEIRNLIDGFYTVQVRDAVAGTLDIAKFIIKKR